MINVARDIAEALENQFSSIKEQFEGEENCDTVCISGIIDDERNIDYAEIESYLMRSWGYEQKDATEMTQLVINEFHGQQKPFEIKWEA